MARTNKNTATQGDHLVERLNQIRQRSQDAAEPSQTTVSDDPTPDPAGFELSPVQQAPVPQPPSQALTIKKPLPMWHEGERAGPNVLMRSSLFGIASSRYKRWVAVASKPRDVMCLGEYQIQMVGEELRQDDGDVLFGILHLARFQAQRGGEVKFVASDFISSLGWNRDGYTYKRLHEIIRRLASTLIIIRGKNVKRDEIREGGFRLLEYDFTDSLKTQSKDGGKWRVTLTPSTVNLFWVTHYSRMHWELRRNLRSVLARYLHILYATYSGLMSFGVEQLHALSGSHQKRLATFRQSLAQAHDELVEAGILASWKWLDKKRTRLAPEMTSIGAQHTWAQHQLDLAAQESADETSNA